MKNEDAVSPVVGVMLMLVVTIIIAAVVSGFSGGLISGQEKSPTLSLDVTIANTGSYIGSGFTASVYGVSDPISTANLKIISSWSTTMKDNESEGLTDDQKKVPEGNIFTGGNTSLPNSANVNIMSTDWSTAPYGCGNTIDTGGNTLDPYGSSADDEQKAGWFGQYTLKEGVSLNAYPYGGSCFMNVGGSAGKADTSSGYNGAIQYAYESASGGSYEQGSSTDAAQAVLGYGWEQLRAGDVVNVKFIYTPTGAAIYSKDVTVEE